MSYTRKKGSGGRDLGLSSNGKGSACRISDNKTFAANYDEIDWGHKKTEAPLPPFVPVPVQPLASVPATDLQPGVELAPEHVAPTEREGWRALPYGETIQAGDEYFETSLGQWSTTVLMGEKVATSNHYFRKL